MAKFDFDKRTFETRVKFINQLFTSRYTTAEIMASCIKYKLGKSYEQYLKDVTKSVWNLEGEDPIKILKKLDK